MLGAPEKVAYNFKTLRDSWNSTSFGTNENFTKQVIHTYVFLYSKGYCRTYGVEPASNLDFPIK